MGYRGVVFKNKKKRRKTVIYIRSSIGKEDYMKSKLLTIEDICDTFGVSKGTAYKIAKEMSHIKVGKRILIPKHEVTIYIKKQLEQRQFRS